MTIVSSPIETHIQEHEPKRFSTVLLDPTDPRFDEWIQTRQDFVVGKHWREETDEERDVYDDDGITAQLVTYGENGELLAGMRLTPVNKISNSLSWEMVKDSTIHAQAADEVEKLQNQLWDLTRLVPGPNLPPAERPEVLRKLLYKGLRYCREQGDNDPVWFFALEKATHAWLRREGIDISLLGKARVGSDDVETLFGFVRPSQIVEDRFAPSALFVRLAQGDEGDGR